MKKILSIVIVLALVFTLSVSAFATPGEVTVNGHIQNTLETDPTIDPVGDPSNPGSYDVTFTSTVHWWVTEASYPSVKNGNASGLDDSVQNVIQNNSTSGTAIKVSLNSFTGDTVAASIASKLTLNLTGALAANGAGSINLASDYIGTTNYTANLDPGTANAWTYGFNGTYTGTLSTTAVTPQYTMTLGFSFA